jgi:hypothetical protein
MSLTSFHGQHEKVVGMLVRGKKGDQAKKIMCFDVFF